MVRNKIFPQTALATTRNSKSHSSFHDMTANTAFLRTACLDSIADLHYSVSQLLWVNFSGLYSVKKTQQLFTNRSNTNQFGASYLTVQKSILFMQKNSDNTTFERLNIMIYSWVSVFVVIHLWICLLARNYLHLQNYYVWLFHIHWDERHSKTVKSLQWHVPAIVK